MKPATRRVARCLTVPLMLFLGLGWDADDNSDAGISRDIALFDHSHSPRSVTSSKHCHFFEHEAGGMMAHIRWCRTEISRRGDYSIEALVLTGATAR